MRKAPFVLLVVGLALMNAACAVLQICYAAHTLLQPREETAQ